MKKPTRWIGEAVDNELAYGSPCPPPRHICPVCGVKYVEGPAPCGHVTIDGIIVEIPGKASAAWNQAGTG